MKMCELKPVTFCLTSLWKPVTTAIVIKLTTTASEILMTDMRIIGLETFLPCASFLSTLRDMKYSTDKPLFFDARKYVKLLGIKSVLLLLISSCGILLPKKEVPVPPTRQVETVVIVDSNEVDTPEPRQEGNVRHSLRQPILGIGRLHLFLDSLTGKKIAVVGNQTSVVGSSHLVDTLLGLGLDVKKVFVPEHGFRGDADAGERVWSSIDEKTGLPLISLYGHNKKPSPEQLLDVDIVIYDIQDVGVRFYTYISTLHYVMEACAENGKQMVVLDRPNPNGHYIDGPVREPEHKSFVGMHPVPIVYGMTIGEYAMMVNGEHWLRDSLSCKLWVIPCKHYTHKTKYVLPVAPSPNLRSELAVSLYPSLCLFEATTVSIGRGTDRPFEVFGHPLFPELPFSFTPTSRQGAKNPLYENRLCHGVDLKLSHFKRKYELNLNYIIQAKDLLGDSIAFIDQVGFFNRLAGTEKLREQINAGWTAKEIRQSWQKGIEAFKKIRQKYLLYD